MLKRLAKIITGALCASLLLTGCADGPELNLTEDESEKIADYSAELLLRYDKNFDKALMTNYQLSKEEARIATKAAAALAGKKNLEGKNGTGTTTESGNNDNTQQVEEIAVSENYAVSENIAETIGVGGFDISFDRIEVCESYPNNEDGSAVFTMRAAGGNELIIWHFKVTNVAGEERTCNILDLQPSFQIILENGEKTEALTTILTNDLAMINEVIKPEEPYDAILAFEKPKGFEDTVRGTKLLVSVSGNQTVIPLAE